MSSIKLFSREESQVVGAYLFIEKVKRVDLGEYICSVSNTEDQVIRLTTLLKEEGEQIYNIGDCKQISLFRIHHFVIIKFINFLTYLVYGAASLCTVLEELAKTYKINIVLFELVNIIGLRI